MNSQNPRLIFSFTNEDLEAIIAGLDPRVEDSVLAVGGSGDQAFALLEFVEKVRAVDVNPKQVEFMKQRTKALADGDYEGFLKPAEGSCDKYIPEDLERRNNYFSKPGRLMQIRHRLGCLDIDKADVVRLAQTERGYTKLYLSNVLVRWTGSKRNIKKILRNVSCNLPVGGLIYVSNPWELRASYSGGLSEDFLPVELILDEKLTKRALKHNHDFDPAVYRKV